MQKSSYSLQYEAKLDYDGPSYSLKTEESSLLCCDTMFRVLDITTHCNAQQHPKFPTLKLTKHCNAQKDSEIANPETHETL